MEEHSQSNNNSNDGDQGKSSGNGDESNGGSSTQGNQGGNQNSSSSEVDFKTLPPDQLQQVLENPKLWETPRLKELLGNSKELKAIKDRQSKAEEEKLKEDKKFEELVGKKDETISQLQTQVQTLRQDQALTNILVKEKVVDLDGALKLVDRSVIVINDDGKIEGIDKAIESLKTDKAYLFSNQSGSGGVGTPSNAGNQNQSNGTPKFKRSQFVGPEGTKFYQANKEAVDEAMKKGLIEDDIS